MFAVCSTGYTDDLDAVDRADPRTWGVRHDDVPPTSKNRPDFELIKVTPELRDELGLADHVDYVLRYVQ